MPDVRGNVIGLADNTGIVVNYEYEAWGNLLSIPQTVLTGNGENLAGANPFRYSGYQFDKETGFYHLNIGNNLWADDEFSNTCLFLFLIWK